MNTVNNYTSKLDTYVTSVLLGHVDKYVRDFKPNDAQVSLWAGGIRMHNLVLKPEVLQQELNLPFTLVSGRIHELSVNVVWTKILSEPILVEINTIECVISLNPPPAERPQAVQREGSQDADSSGYIQAAIRRILNNMKVKVNSLIVKCVHDDIVLSLNVKNLLVDCVDGDWQPLSEMQSNLSLIRRLVHLDDLTLCLDKRDSDGKIRFYHEPMLCRCQMDLRIISKLVSANNLRTRSVSVQLLCKNVSWEINNEQVVLLLRLLTERTPAEVIPLPVPRQASAKPPPPPPTTVTIDDDSWSDWVMSWLPSFDWSNADEVPAPGTPTPITFSAYFNSASLVFKIMEPDGTGRKKARSVLELKTSDTVIKSFICSPTVMRFNFGTRSIILASKNKCVCGYMDFNAVDEKPTVYVRKIERTDEQPWSWNPEEHNEPLMEVEESADEEEPEYELPDVTPENEDAEEIYREIESPDEKLDQFWRKMAPVVYIGYEHNRTPPNEDEDPYENPPKDFQYSDWIEDSKLKVYVNPVTVNVCTGLLHRLTEIKKAVKEVCVHDGADLPMRRLTLEESDALVENVPMRRFTIFVRGLRLRVLPTNHSQNERAVTPPIVLDVHFPKTLISSIAPLYSYRVCSAACQMTQDMLTTMLDKCRVRVALDSTVEVGTSLYNETASRQCARAQVRATAHSLLHRQLFRRNITSMIGCHAKLSEITVCGSAARLQAAYYVIMSLLNSKLHPSFCKTTLVEDALQDQEAVAIDFTLENLRLKTAKTRNYNVVFFTINSIKCTTFHYIADGELKQAWVFAGPESPIAVPYLECAFQWCNDPLLRKSLEYISVIIKPTALSLDPMFISWLSYRYKKTGVVIAPMPETVKPVSTSHSLSRRRATPPSSSGRGPSRHGSGAELIHVKPTSNESCSERSDRRENIRPVKKDDDFFSRYTGDRLVQLYNRLNRLLFIVEVGLTQVYVSPTDASAVNCVNVGEAMDQHVMAGHKVLVFSLRRFLIQSNKRNVVFWHGVKFGQPSPRTVDHAPDQKEDLFPWHISFDDLSCYTLDWKRERTNLEKLVNQCKQKASPTSPVPRPILDAFTTSITITLGTKDLTNENAARNDHKPKRTDLDREEDKLKSFLTGSDFQPTTLLEFFRGQAKKPKTEDPEPGPSKPGPSQPDPNPPAPDEARGPYMSLGLDILGDSRPIHLKLKSDQVQIVVLAMHCFAHVLTLLRSPSKTPKQRPSSSGASQKTVTRSVSEQDHRRSASEATTSERRSDPLISIFQARAPEPEPLITPYFWFQWVVSRITLVVSTHREKLAVELDEIIVSVDLQSHYKQLKSKVTSFSVRNYKRKYSLDWLPGPLNGRVLVVREPCDLWSGGPFIAFTVTRAKISTLPLGWKDDPKVMHPKTDTILEVYAHIAPLDILIEPDVLENLLKWIGDLTYQPPCSLLTPSPKPAIREWPFCYITIVGVRLTLICGEDADRSDDDTLVLVTKKINISPHPENPICRQSVNPDSDGCTWAPLRPELDARQYECLFKSVAITSAKLSELINEEGNGDPLNNGSSENPALKWTQRKASQDKTPLLHPVNVCLVVAPTVYDCGALASGPAFEFNLLSRCSMEIDVEHIDLIQTLTQNVLRVITSRSGRSFLKEEARKCIYSATQTTTDAPVENEPSVSNINPPETTCHETSQPQRTLTETTRPETTGHRPTRPDTLHLRYTHSESMRAETARPETLHLRPIRPETIRVDTAPPETLHVRTIRSEAVRAETSRPGTSRPETIHPGTSRSGTTQPTRPGTSQSGTHSETTCHEEASNRSGDVNRGLVLDSGVETTTSQSTSNKNRVSAPIKKSVSIACIDNSLKPKDYLDVYVTMGVVDISLYVKDDNSRKIRDLRPPPDEPEETTETPKRTVIDEAKELKLDDDKDSTTESRSLSENIRSADSGKTKLEDMRLLPLVRGTLGNLPLIHVTLQQPNFYYTKKNKVQSVQIGAFDAWVGLGAGPDEEKWNAPLLTTARGSPDTITDITPSFASLRIDHSPGAFPSLNKSVSRGSVQLDIERPVMFDICSDRIRRLKGIIAIFKKNITVPETFDEQTEEEPVPVLYKLRRSMVNHKIDSIVIQTGQIGVRGSEGVAGWDSLDVQLATRRRSPRLSCRALVCAALIAAGPPTDKRHVILQPLMAGMVADVHWEPWRRVEPGSAAVEPSIHVNVELDKVVLDVRPKDIEAAMRIYYAAEQDLGCTELLESLSSPTMNQESTSRPTELSDLTDQFYKDDLRSGVFKLVMGGQLPMAYQITLHDNAVTWKYPQQRTLTRLVVFPIPDLEDDTVECVLELYCSLTERWEAHTYFHLPVSEPLEVVLTPSLNDAVFALMWRVRVCSDAEKSPPYVFIKRKFMPRLDPLSVQSLEPGNAEPAHAESSKVSAVQLAGILRVDSYFAPQYMPRADVALRVAALELHAHNQLPTIERSPNLEGYYVTPALTANHRVLTLRARNTYAHFILSTSSKVVLDTNLSSDMINCANGAMERLIEEFRLQGSIGLCKQPRMRVRAGDVRMSLLVARADTLLALVDDWSAVYEQCVRPKAAASGAEAASVAAADAQKALRGRVSLWVHNTCTVPLRIGQRSTTEVATISSGTSYAYRWRSARAPKELRFGLTSSSMDWFWSRGVTFEPGSYCVLLEDTRHLSSAPPATPTGVDLHVIVRANGTRRDMYLCGKLLLANMLRHDLTYKVRNRCLTKKSMQVISGGVLQSESIGHSILCNLDHDENLKIKLTTTDNAWSGDIPLRHGRKNNVPWLVKIPTEDMKSYFAVWCRVSRARSDGRLLATVWPFYMLRSFLPLDIKVLATTEGISPANERDQSNASQSTLQTAAGRGATTHLALPGTTSAKHTITFKYGDVDGTVTTDAISLHYGMCETSVFDKSPQINNIDEVVESVKQWLKDSSQEATTGWPYTTFAKHWTGKWVPATTQPKSDINICYEPVRVGGGCSMELQLRPVALLANAFARELTLRGHDGAPLCTLAPGDVLSPPLAFLEKPFFVSVNESHESFVSGPLEVCKEEQGRYGQPPPGQIALERCATCAIHCGRKVMLMSFYYEIKHEINIIGITSPYLLINRVNAGILVAQVAMTKNTKYFPVRTKYYTFLHTAKEGSFEGAQLNQFHLKTRWRGGDASELHLFATVAMSDGLSAAHRFVPLLLGHTPSRRAFAVKDEHGRSIPVVATQIRHDERWVITLAEDPCPQFVVNNRTKTNLVIGQPTHIDEDPERPVKIVEECEGASWCCVAEAEGSVHYSTPAYCARYPPPDNPRDGAADDEHRYYITVGPYSVIPVENDLVVDVENTKWCQPILIKDGEQLLQLSGDIKIKLRVRTHPHSTLIEFQEFDEFDISASLIRNRLGMASNEQSQQGKNERQPAIGGPASVASRPLDQASSSTNAETTPRRRRLPEIPQEAIIAKTQQIQKKIEMNKLKLDQDTVDDSSRSKISRVERDAAAMAYENEIFSTTAPKDSTEYYDNSYLTDAVSLSDWSESNEVVAEREVVRGVVSRIVITVGAFAKDQPLIAIHLQRLGVRVKTDTRKMKTTLAIADVKVDNTQYKTELYDFAVIATTRAQPQTVERWPAFWATFNEAMPVQARTANFWIKTCHENWISIDRNFRELTELEVFLGSMGLYVEDEFVAAMLELYHLALPNTPLTSDAMALAESQTLAKPFRIMKLNIRPLDLSLTLHTAVRMYIALDESPLRLSGFTLEDAMTSYERLTHALTVHYLSAAILGAGWVVGGLELLGAPGALASRVGSAGGGLRGVASAAAGALLRSLSSAAGSLARNLDLLAGDDEHARRAAAARRHPPPNLMAGLVTGIANFAVNILGAVGGLAHHPLVGVAVGESDSGAAALRRGIVGAITKPLSATADLVAFAGHGLLSQTGWDPVPRPTASAIGDPDEAPNPSGWSRDCVRWVFQFVKLGVLTGFEAHLATAKVQLIVTHKYLIMIEISTESIYEMIDFKYCSLGVCNDKFIELFIKKKKKPETRAVINEEGEIQVSAEAMARVARYTGAEVAADERLLTLRPSPDVAPSLYAALAAAVHHCDCDHFGML